MRLRRPWPIILAVCFVAAGFVGCDQGDDSARTVTVELPEGSPTPGDAPSTLLGPGANGGVCPLLDAATLSTLAGEPMGNPAPIDMGAPLGQQVCTFGALDAGSYTTAQVSLVTMDGLAGSLRETDFTVTQLFDESFSRAPDAILVHGIGDAAFRHKNTLEVLSGEATFSVRLSRTDGTAGQPVSLETLVAMAAVVIERISPEG